MKYIFTTIILLSTFIANAQLPVRITTVAGTGTYGYSGDGGLATAANLAKPNSVAVDKWQNVYFIDVYNQRVRKITPTGYISTVAGNGVMGFSGDGGPATNAKVYFPTGVAVDTAGNIFIADYSNQRIRKVNSAGIISTYAGTGVAGYFGDGGQATAAQLWAPQGIATDLAGNLYIAEFNNYIVRKVTPAGIISTVAGTPGSSGGTGDGGLATNATFGGLVGVGVDKVGNIYVCDQASDVIRKIDATTHIIRRFAGNGILTFSGDGGPATSAGMYYPASVSINDSGYVYSADYINCKVRAISPTNTITTIAGSGTMGYGGDGGLATAAAMYYPIGTALDSLGNIYVADYYNNRIRKIRIHCIPYAGKIFGSSPICPCNPVRFHAQLPGGTWSVTNGNATINDSGWVHAVSPGLDTIVYTYQDSCGPATVSAVVTLLSTGHCDSINMILGKHFICIDSAYHFTDSLSGGTWSVTGSHLSVNDTGMAYGLSQGIDTIKYAVTDSCGVTIKSFPVTVLSKPQCDSANYIGMVQTEQGDNVEIYPNPATNMLTIKMGNNEFVSYTIVSYLGDILCKNSIIGAETNIDLRRFSPGFYFIKFVGKNRTEIKKFLKE